VQPAGGGQEPTTKGECEGDVPVSRVPGHQGDLTRVVVREVAKQRAMRARHRHGICLERHETDLS